MGDRTGRIELMGELLRQAAQTYAEKRFVGVAADQASYGEIEERSNRLSAGCSCRESPQTAFRSLACANADSHPKPGISRRLDSSSSAPSGASRPATS